jgi:hypothetical protein
MEQPVWRKTRRGKETEVVGVHLAVRKDGKRFKASYCGLIVGSRFKTELAAQKAAIKYAIEARTSHAGPTKH